MVEKVGIVTAVRSSAPQQSVCLSFPAKGRKCIATGRKPKMLRLLALVVATACLADAALMTPGRPAFARVTASSARINRVGPAPLMFFDQFDKDAMRVIMDAQVESRNLGGTEVEAQHLLLAATVQKGPVQKSLQRSGVESDAIKAVLNPGNAAFPALDRLFAATSKDELLPFAKDTERAFRASLDRCQKRGELVSSQELIFSVLQDEQACRDGCNHMRARLQPHACMQACIHVHPRLSCEQADSSAARLLAALKLDRAEVASQVEKGEALELVGAGGGANRKNSTLAQCSTAAGFGRERMAPALRGHGTRSTRRAYPTGHGAPTHPPPLPGARSRPPRSHRGRVQPGSSQP